MIHQQLIVPAIYKDRKAKYTFFSYMERRQILIDKIDTKKGYFDCCLGNLDDDPYIIGRQFLSHN